MTQPSRIAESLLTLVVRDAELRDSILGDLREEFDRLARRAGPQRARRWHLQQSLGIAARYGASRLLRRKPPVRWISLADAEPDGPWWSGLGRDVRHAWRAIWQRPALSMKSNYKSVATAPESEPSEIAELKPFSEVSVVFRQRAPAAEPSEAPAEDSSQGITGAIVLPATRSRRPRGHRAAR